MQPTKFNARTSATVLEAIEKGHSLRSAAGLVGVSHTAVNDWIKARPAFRAKVEQAKARAIDRCLSVIVEAIPDDPRLAERIISKLDREQWGERVQTEHTGEGGGPITIDLRWPDVPTPPSQMP